MDITIKKYNLLRLWLESFAVINKCTGKLVKTILCLILLIALVVAVLALGIGTSALLGKLQMTLLAQTVSFGTAILYILTMLISNLLGLFFITVVWQIVSTHILHYTQPLSETFSSSVWPTIYQFIATILLAIPSMIVFAVLALGARATPVLVVFGGILAFLVGVRLCYSFIAIAIDNRGPIEGIVQSWKMTSGKNYIDALLMCLMLVGSMALLEAFFLLVAYVLYTFIPLYFAENFSLAHPSLMWWLLGLVLLVLAVFYYFAILAFPVLVFLNRTSQERLAEQEQTNDTIFIPLPELETPAQPQTAKETDVDSLSAGQTNDQSVPTDPVVSQEASLPSSGDELQLHSMEDLKVTKTSVNTSDEDTNEITQQLHKVYTPRPDDIVQYGSEDRMPTILFDDKLAQQLQQEHNVPPSTQNAADDIKRPDDDTPIELSK